MRTLSNICCICLQQTSNLKSSSEVDGDELTYFNKLVFCIPELNLDEISQRGMLCSKCCEYIGNAYICRKLYVKNNMELMDHIKESQSTSNEPTDEKSTATSHEGHGMLEALYCETKNIVNCTDDIKEDELSNITIDEEKYCVQKSIGPNQISCLQSLDEIKSETDVSINETVTKEEGLDELLKKNSLDCDICKKSFLDISDLNIHMQTHTPQKSFKCVICKKYFTNKFFLNCHMQTHKEENQSEQRKKKRIAVTKMYASKVLKCYECEYCTKKFNALSRLMWHMRTHTGEKPYECVECCRKFAALHYLNRHQHIHAAEKYICDICNRKFTYKCNYSSHMKTHNKRKNKKNVSQKHN